jgi:hypothetical protein
VAIDKIIGFDGLIDGLSEDKLDEWSTATLAKLLATKNAIDKENIVDDQADAEEARKRFESVRRSTLAQMTDEDLDELALSD